MDGALELLRQSWGLAWFGFVASSATVIRNLYAAERDRQALRQLDLEKQKLELEVTRLRNDPAVVADRRVLYERLRDLLLRVLTDCRPTVEEIAILHGIRHDSEFRFPSDIPSGLETLIRNFVALYSTRERMEWMQSRLGAPDAEWSELVARNSDALQAVSHYQENMIATFKPHITL